MTNVRTAFPVFLRVHIFGIKVPLTASVLDLVSVPQTTSRQPLIPVLWETVEEPERWFWPKICVRDLNENYFYET